VAHYLVKFDREKKSYIKVRIAPQADKSRIKILKKFVVLSEDTVLSYEKDETSFRLIKYKF